MPGRGPAPRRPRRHGAPAGSRAGSRFPSPSTRPSASIVSAPGSSVPVPTARRRAGSAGSTAPASRRPRLSPNICAIVWLTPDLDALFRGPAGDRRRFLDRLVLAVDSEHGARVNALERALRSRNRILEENPDNRLWLDAVEREVAELAIAVASARRETVQRLACADPVDPGRRVAIPLRHAEPRRRDRHARGDASGRRRGGPLSGDPARQPSTRPRRGAHARRTAGHRHAGAPRPEGHPRQPRLDGRAEGPAHRPRAGPCAARRQHERASRRSCFSTRSRPISTRAAAPAFSRRSRPSAARSG